MVQQPKRTKRTAMTSIFVATPCYQGQLTEEFARSMFGLVEACAKLDIKLVWRTVQDSMVCRARNTLVAEFMQSDCESLMFIDADIGFAPKSVLDCLKSIPNDAIFAGDYRIKDGSGRWVGVPFGDVSGNLPYSSIVASYAPTGFMMIRREVFERISQWARQKVVDTNGDESPLPRYLNVNSEQISQYFRASVDLETDSLLSEDYHFCKLARAAGIDIYLSRNCAIKHVGRKVYE